MPRWFVQLVGEHIDVTEFSRWFPNGPVCAVEENGTVYLTGTAFETLSDADAVREEARKRVQECSGIILLEWGAFRPPTIGAVKCDNDRGGRDVTVPLVGEEARGIASSVGVAAGRSKVSGVGEAIGGPAQEPQLTSAQTLLQRASGNDHLRAALYWFSKRPATGADLYKALEEIESYLWEVHRKRWVHQVKPRLCTQDDRQRFADGVNRSSVLGDDARHAGEKPPPRLTPMDLPEAAAFIQRLLVAVLSR